MGYFTSTKATIISIAIGIFLFLMNVAMSSFIDYDTATTNITCFDSSMFIAQMRVNWSICKP